MNVLALKPGHDGSVALVSDGRLVFSLEAQADSGDRHEDFTASLMYDSLTLAPEPPDILAIGGWHRLLPGRLGASGAGYRGMAPGRLEPSRLFGRSVLVYSSSHERSHVIGGIAMSPFDPTGDIAVLVWEGVIGSLYHWRGPDQPADTFPVLDQPGARYAALFALAEPSFPDSGAFPSTVFAGKLMALAGLADDQEPTTDSRQVVEALLRRRSMYPFDKHRFRRSGLYDSGVEAPELCRAARLLTLELFARYLEAARAVLPPGLPLVVVGGCGLNCDWNRAWSDCGHFSEVFVPPCADDSGSAIGTAVDAALQAGAPCSLDWDVYSGAEFVHDRPDGAPGWTARALDLDVLSGVIDTGSVVSWVQGRAEIGPRALGHRSLLASVAGVDSRDELNRIKGREGYRPIAPVCLETDLGTWFDRDFPDPHMLFFRRVVRPEVMPAVTHADGTARVQSVTPRSGGRLHDLLVRHRQRTGIGVLCNTSLNFSGRGFINRSSDLFLFCEQAGISHAVVDDVWFRRYPPEPEVAR